MVSVRFFSFVLVFIFVLIGESSEHRQGTYSLKFPAMVTIPAADGTGLESARKNQEAYDAVPAAAEVWDARLDGRKMMFKWGSDKKTVAVLEGSDEEDSAKISGADDQSVGTSNHTEKGILNVNRKVRNRNRHSHRHEKPKTAGFTAFSADYHVPKSHPPKNN